MARRSEEPTCIGYADLETSNPLDLEEIGKLRVKGNGLLMDMPDGTSVIPTVWVKCAGLIVHKDGCKPVEYMYHSVEELLKGLVEHRVQRCYFHNLKFDDSYIASFMKNESIDLGDGWSVKCKSRTISKRGGIVYSDVLAYTGPRDEKTHRRVKFTCSLWDSMKIWNNPLEKIGKTFGMVKGGTTGGSQALEKGCNELMEEYCLQDCRIMMAAMEDYFERCSKETQGQRKKGWMTAASTAYNLMEYYVRGRIGNKEFDNIFPPCTEENGFKPWEREGYKGAVPLLDPEERFKILHDVSVFDVNSMYPNQLVNARLPMGKPVELRNADMDRLMRIKERGQLWVAKVKMIADVKPGHRATFVLKRKNEDGETLAWHINDFDTANAIGDSFQVITSVDIEYILRDYDIRYIEVLEAQGYRVDEKHVIAPFVLHWYVVKQHAAEIGDKALKEFAKLILNALYGKFGTNPEHIAAYYDFIGDMIRLKESDKVEHDDKPKYLPVAMFVTAYARNMISKACNALGWEHTAYTDTDSVHVHGMSAEDAKQKLIDDGFEIHHTNLGAFDFESRWRDAMYVRNKGYFHFCQLDNDTGEELGDGHIDEIKMAGANKFSFRSIEEVVDKKLIGIQKRAYRVNGGVLIYEHETTIDTREEQMHKVRKVKGMNEEQSMIELTRREKAFKERWSVA